MVEVLLKIEFKEPSAIAIEETYFVLQLKALQTSWWSDLGLSDSSEIS